MSYAIVHYWPNPEQSYSVGPIDDLEVALDMAGFYYAGEGFSVVVGPYEAIPPNIKKHKPTPSYKLFPGTKKIQMLGWDGGGDEVENAFAMKGIDLNDGSEADSNYVDQDR